MTKKRPPNQWQPGQTGNPKGRPPGQSVITKLRATLASDVPEILAVLVTAAKGGDMQAARLILERVLPPVKAAEQAVLLPIQEGDTLTANGRVVLSAIAAGELPPTQGAQLMSAIGSLARVVEIDELAARITALESKHEED